MFVKHQNAEKQLVYALVDIIHRHAYLSVLDIALRLGKPFGRRRRAAVVHLLAQRYVDIILVFANFRNIHVGQLYGNARNIALVRHSAVHTDLRQPRLHGILHSETAALLHQGVLPYYGIVVGRPRLTLLKRDLRGTQRRTEYRQHANKMMFHVFSFFIVSVCKDNYIGT